MIIVQGLAFYVCSFFTAQIATMNFSLAKLADDQMMRKKKRNIGVAMAIFSLVSFFGLVYCILSAL